MTKHALTTAVLAGSSIVNAVTLHDALAAGRRRRRPAGPSASPSVTRSPWFLASR